MKFTKLGRTGLDCSRLGFGTWQIGGGRWKGMARAESVALLLKAADCGVNLFDAAVVYGQYAGELGERRSHSLELLGEAFGGGRRDQVFLCLKLGQVDEYSHRATYNPARMVDELHRALKLMKTEYVDICLVHAPSLAEVREGRALAVVQTIQALGLARFSGYSFEAEPDHAALALTQAIDVLMVQYNLIDQQCRRVFQEAAERGVGILVGGPLKRGYLSGRYETADELPLDDNYWAWNLRYARDRVNEILRESVAMKIAAGGARQLRLRAFRQILQEQSASSVIVGHRSSDEVLDNARAIEEILGEVTDVG